MTFNENICNTIFTESNISNKQNYNNILAFIQEITMFSLYIDGLKLQRHVREQKLDNSSTLNRIDRLQKTWDRINLNLDLNFNATVRDNLILEVDKSLDNVAIDIKEINSKPYDNKNEILEALAGATNHLNELKDKLQKMVVTE